MHRDPFLEAAIEEARKGAADGDGIPIGSVLVIDNTIVGRGYNRRVQKGSAILHAEMDCIENAGRLDAKAYRKATLYTTLSPCFMCSGTALLYGIPRIVIGENRTFRGIRIGKNGQPLIAEDVLRSVGVVLDIMDDEECFRLMEAYRKAHPEVWAQDIGEVPHTGDERPA